jgi:uncharacterized protein (DUF2141 family)
MKSSLFALSLLTLIGSTSFAYAGPLTINLGNDIKPGDTLMIAVYADNTSWLKKPVRSLRERAPEEARTSGSHQLSVDELAPGRYALAVYVDRNGNGKLDRGMFGIPKEPYGFSGKGGVMGPPDFVDAAFEVPEAGARIRIRLR